MTDSIIEQLKRFGLEGKTINLAQGGILEVLAVVRTIPGRRLVCKCLWNNMEVFAKIFIGTEADRYASRDAHGISLLLDAGINTAALLHSDDLLDVAGRALIFELINAPNSEELYPQLAREEAFKLAVLLVKEIAGHHNSRILQTDLYLKNFLVQDDSIYTLDGDGIRQYAFLSKRQALVNLAVLISKFDILDAQYWLPSLLEIYAKARIWSACPNTHSMMKMVNSHREHVVSEYATKKVFRQCTDVQVYRGRDFFEAVSTRFSFQGLPFSSKNYDALIISGRQLKNGNTCSVSMASIEGFPVVIKRYNIKNFWHGVSRGFRQTRAAVSWANAHRLKLLGIPTPDPVMLLETCRIGMKRQAYFVSGYLEAPDAGDFFENCTNENTIDVAVKNLVNLFYRLYLLKISHGDTKATNIKMVGDQPYLIDLDNMKQHSLNSFALRKHARDLHRFMQNWKKSSQLEAAFVTAFKSTYLDLRPLQLAHII